MRSPVSSCLIIVVVISAVGCAFSYRLPCPVIKHGSAIQRVGTYRTYQSTTTPLHASTSSNKGTKEDSSFFADFMKLVVDSLSQVMKPMDEPRKEFLVDANHPYMKPSTLSQLRKKHGTDKKKLWEAEDIANEFRAHYVPEKPLKKENKSAEDKRALLQLLSDVDKMGLLSDMSRHISNLSSEPEKVLREKANGYLQAAKDADLQLQELKSVLEKEVSA